MVYDAERLSEIMETKPGNLREYLLAFYPKLADKIPPMDHVVRTARPMVAHVNSGIWKATCECGARTDLQKQRVAPGCVVWLSQPVGFCIRCGNQATGRGWRPVTVPPEAMRAEIEAILRCRPDGTTQNWEPSESIADLLTQNREHGDPTPEDIELQHMGAH